MQQNLAVKNLQGTGSNSNPPLVAKTMMASRLQSRTGENGHVALAYTIAAAQSTFGIVGWRMS